MTTSSRSFAPVPRLQGVLSPAVTPFKADLAPDAQRFVEHCRWLLDNGCDGLAVFGTNSEATSLSGTERMELLETLVGAGIPAARLMPGTGFCSLTETVEVTRHAVRLGCAGVLALPPFYYKGVPEEGLYRHFAETIERVGDDRLNLYLYHIPPVAQVGISPSLVGRLLDAYGPRVAGLKDSSGDWKNTELLMERFAARGFDVFAGSEVFLLRTLRAGGKGCITAGANVNPHGIAQIYRAWQTPDADGLQAKADAIRKVLQDQPSMIPALKSVIAHFAGDPEWVHVRPPLVNADPAGVSALIAALTALGFDMPGRRI